MSHSPLRIGSLRPEHRERIAGILRATHVFREEEVDVALELFDESVGAGAAAAGSEPPTADYVFLGAFTPEDELAGYACYGPTPGTDRTFDLYWIAVAPEAQGTGCGTTLLGEVERRLGGHDARLLVVETSSRSTYDATREFYARRGYGEAARMRDFYAPADDRIIYVKRFQGIPAGSGAAPQ